MAASGATSNFVLTKMWTRSWTLVVSLLLLSCLFFFAMDIFGDGVDGNAKEQFRRFLAGAFSPTLTSEAAQGHALFPELIDATKRTVLVAFAAMSLAVLGGFILGCLASEAFWPLDPVVMESPKRKFVRCFLRPFFLIAIRTLMALTRSIHEMFWALLGVAVFGLSITCGIFAIAIPYAVTLGRIYAELLDETERDAADALRDCGARSMGIFAFGLLPRAASAMLSYTFYRVDCALRSSAILGFIGFPTLGLGIRSAVKYNFFREAWTFLYVLIFLLIATEIASGILRKRIAAWR